MTEKINCKKCRMLLYFGEEIKRRLYMRAIPSEETVLGFYGNKCPRCGARLTLKTVAIRTEGRKKYVAR
jgi:predicted nucleic-acid-binding Zn-ribbon protein